MTGIVLHLLRHGVTDAEGRLIGRTDATPLPEGVKACAIRATGLQFEAVFSSGLERTRVPAEKIAASHGLVAHADARWRELDFGSWDGQALDAIDSQALAAFQSEPANHTPPQGEAWAALVARVGEAIAAIERPTLIVTHGGAMRAALANLCAIDFPQLWNIALPHAALLSVRIWPGTPRVGQIIGLVT
ncbi:histidine phosphatase family protein [Sphingomonas sp. TDK1]|uniref:histidine phosphatase family protein n=1 Tax=Sphingomonas sp. TDK1 TaxID=453247 RepID=UPI0007D9E549|nr:histidine phosphatase family protein [Sphingomonas sp. TDK1]OAN60155.1 histidine phosphatase family protein [Sphingomonas sp. TDK1]